MFLEVLKHLKGKIMQQYFIGLLTGLAIAFSISLHYSMSTKDEYKIEINTLKQQLIEATKTEPPRRKYYYKGN